MSASVPPPLPARASYEAFLEAKVARAAGAGIWPPVLPDFLFPFQRALVEWALGCGSAAIFADCGLGKTPMQLVWSENVVRHVREHGPRAGRVLLLTPLAVAQQTIREGQKFGIEARRSSDGRPAGPGPDGTGITVTNYERLHLFSPGDWDALVCDESSILKSFDGALKSRITAFMRSLQFRLLCTATAAPNDYVELGTSSEALGYLGYMDMLARFFKNDQNTCDTGRRWAATGGGGPNWRFKGHSEEPFWRWVCSWARAVRKPSDLGFSDEGFVLPPLDQVEHVVEARTLAPGALFALPAVGLSAQREERRRTIAERCEKVARLVDHDDQALVWCHLNREGDLLEESIRGAIQVSGKDVDDLKEEKLLDFAEGRARVLVTKPAIGAWGLNFQRCAHVTSFPSHSFEQYYQGLRRCLRYGQKRRVRSDVVTTEGERGVLENLNRKAAAADRMFERLVVHMNNSMRIERGAPASTREEVPSWLA